MERLIEIGISVSEEDSKPLVGAAVESVRNLLGRAYSRFEWRFALRALHSRDGNAVTLLDGALSSLESNQTDFELVLTDQHLVDPRGRRTPGAISNLLNVGAISTLVTNDCAPSERQNIIAKRLLMAIAALNGVVREEWRVDSSLREGVFLSPEGHAQLQTQLESVADERLEERELQSNSPLVFSIRAILSARRELLQTILRGRPWLFPFRLPKLMAGAASAGLVVMLTAEAWALGASQSWVGVGVAAGIVWTATVLYLLARENVIARRLARRSEQRVIARTAMALGVAMGMLLAFAVAGIVSWTIGWAFYPPDLIENWTSYSFAPLILVKVAIFVATLGLGVGAMGVSLDAPSSFKYAVVVTAELGDDDGR